MENRPPVNVLITVDTEIWPEIIAANRRAELASIKGRIDKCIYGLSPKGAYGISYQMDVLDKYGLKAVFFVEALCACAIGIEPLAEIVTKILLRGHEVQLHIHTEWLEWMDKPILDGIAGKNIKEFSEKEQSQLISRGLQNIKEAGVSSIQAFRAGNYGANFATLSALAKNGIFFDSSYNYCYITDACALNLSEPLLQSRMIDKVCEVPISFFSDYPGHCRHAQLCACSYREMTSTLNHAWLSGWQTFVIVSHSFEFLKRRSKGAKQWQPCMVNIRRFEKLCSFLSKNRDKYQTVGFSQLDPYSISRQVFSQEFKSKIAVTILRYGEQFIARM